MGVRVASISAAVSMDSRGKGAGSSVSSPSSSTVSNLSSPTAFWFSGSVSALSVDSRALSSCARRSS